MKKLALLLSALLLLTGPLCSHAAVLSNWTILTNNSLTLDGIVSNAFPFDALTYGNGCYVAHGQYYDDGPIITSTDGLHWSLTSSGNSSWGMHGWTYTAGQFIGVSFGYGVVAASPDGTNWTLTSLPAIYQGDLDTASPNGITCYSNSTTLNFVVVGETNTLSGATQGYIITSLNRSAWTLQHVYTPLLAPTTIGTNVTSIANGNGILVALGDNDGTEYYLSPTNNAGYWIKTSIAGGSQVYYCKNVFIVPYNSGTNLISSDGITWTTAATGCTNLLSQLAYANGLFTASAGGYLATSANGTNWFTYSVPLPGGIGLASNGTNVVNLGNVYSGGIATGEVFTASVLINIAMTNAPSPKIAASGLAGLTYGIQSATNLAGGSVNWITNATLLLTNPSVLWTDYGMTTNSHRFYRAALVP